MIGCTTLIVLKYNCSFSISLLYNIIDIDTNKRLTKWVYFSTWLTDFYGILDMVCNILVYMAIPNIYIKLERYSSSRERAWSNLRALTPPIYLLLVVLSSAELSMKSMTCLGELMVVNRAYHQSRICGKDHCNVHLSQSASDATPHCVLKCVLWGYC